MNKDLPVNAPAILPKSPWLLHALPVNALNFCAFAMCFDGMPPYKSDIKAVRENITSVPILFAVPNAVDSGGVCLGAIAFYHDVADGRPDRYLPTPLIASSCGHTRRSVYYHGYCASRMGVKAESLLTANRYGHGSWDSGGIYTNTNSGRI